jgi:hypothetical protein
MGARTRPKGPAWAALAAGSLLIIAACGGGDSASETTETTSTTGVPATAEPAITTTTTTTSMSPTTESVTTTEPDYPTTTVHREPATCDSEVADMLEVVDESIAAAQLDTNGDWTDDTTGATFDDRTHDAAEFRYRLGLDCAIRLVQSTPDGAERLVVAAWTGDRRAWVVQATDGPEVPYRADQRVQLFIDQPLGEWLVDQFVWAGSLTTGDTVIVGTVDTTFGLTAKSWWNEVPRFDDLEVTNAAERSAIDVLIHAGNRNVSVAEPANFGTEIAAVQFVTPLGLHLIGTIAPPDWFDPAAPIVEGEMAVEQIAGVDVYVTNAVPESYAIGSVGWACDDYVWFIDAAYGTLEELTDWTAQLIASSGC